MRLLHHVPTLRVPFWLVRRDIISASTRAGTYAIQANPERADDTLPTFARSRCASVPRDLTEAAALRSLVLFFSACSSLFVVLLLSRSLPLSIVTFRIASRD